jgi:hypothetical protein
MRRENTMTAVAAAVLTAAVTLALAWPTGVRATGPESEETGAAAVPDDATLALGSLRITAAADLENPAAGSTPTFTLHARNLGEVAARDRVRLRLMRRSAISTISRMPPAVEVVWTGTVEVSADAKGLATFPVKPGVAVAGGQTLALVATPVEPEEDEASEDRPLLFDPSARWLADVTGSLLPEDRGE